jgi:hypothetical protein
VFQVSSIEFSGLSRSRKTVIASSIFLLIVSNLDLANDQISLFGLQIIISKENLISAGRILVALSLLGLIGAIAREAPRNFARFLRRRDAVWWEPIEKEIAKYHEYDPRHPEDDQHWMEWDDHAYLERTKRKERRLKIAGIGRQIAVILDTIRDIVLPILVAIVAVFFPELILSI